MKPPVFMFLIGGTLLFSARLLAQTSAAGPASSDNLSPAKIAEYQQRFESGYELEKEGNLEQARSIYDAILAEQPDAKRSLLEAGRISLKLHEPLKAQAYLEKLHALVPDFPTATELLIQADQALREDAKVEQLVLGFRVLRDSGKVAGFGDSLFFERENVDLPGGAEIVFSQFFNFLQPPYFALKAELFDARHTRRRVLVLKYDPEGTAVVRAKNAKIANDTVFILAELFVAGDRMNRIDVYQELLSTPDYEKARSLMLGIFSHTPKAILSTPIDAAAP